MWFTRAALLWLIHSHFIKAVAVLLGTATTSRVFGHHTPPGHNPLNVSGRKGRRKERAKAQTTAPQIWTGYGGDNIQISIVLVVVSTFSSLARGLFLGWHDLLGQFDVSRCLKKKKKVVGWWWWWFLAEGNMESVKSWVKAVQIVMKNNYYILFANSE